MHIGERIQARAKELRMGPTELSKKIRTSKQNIFGIYKRDSINTALLQKLSKALEFDFFVYYGTTGSNLSNDPKGTYSKGKKNRLSDDEILSLQKELTDLKEKYELLKELYETKTGKKVPGAIARKKGD
jgi:hypothetical protein